MSSSPPPLNPNLLAQVALQSHTAVVVTDAAGATVWVNPAFERMSGHRLSDLLGRKPGTVLQTAGTDATVVARISSALRRQEPVIGAELLNVTQDGRPYWVRLDISPVRDAHGAVTHFLSVQTDITAQHTEAERRETDALESLRDLERQDVLARLRREFRLPLNSLLGFAQLLRVDAEQGGLASMAQRIEHIEAAGLQLLDMLDEMLAHAGGDNERATLQPVGLWDTLDRHLPREVAVVDPGEDLRHVVVWADPTLLRRTVSLAGSMGLTPGRAGTGPRLELLADPLRRRHGLRFSYPSGVRSPPHGQAMRMDLIRRLVGDMGGTIDVEDVDTGCRITLYLRAASGLREPGEEASGARMQPDVPASPWAQRADIAGRVLYVEDDHGNVEVVRHALRSRPGVRLEVAESVDEAEAVLARSGAPDLLLVDLMLPGRGGQALLELRAQSSTLVRVPCVVLTSVDDLVEEESLRALGADDYLVKPLRLDRLLRLVDQHLAPGRAP